MRAAFRRLASPILPVVHRNMIGVSPRRSSRHRDAASGSHWEITCQLRWRPLASGTKEPIASHVERSEGRQRNVEACRVELEGRLGQNAIGPALISLQSGGVDAEAVKRRGAEQPAGKEITISFRRLLAPIVRVVRSMPWNW